jgi:uncharacterized protein YdaU (DUF1376 family)
MSKMPKMNLWIDAFNSDTSFLTDEELGIYFRLIFYAWGKEGYLPNDYEFIVNLTRNRNENAIRKVLSLYWNGDDKGYYQKRLVEEYQRAVSITETNRQNAMKRYEVAEQPQSDRNASISISNSISKSNKDIIDKNFDKFWEEVCYKISKGQARRNYRKLHKDWWEEPKMLAKKYNDYYNSLKDKQYAQHPSTWLNAEGFLNQDISIKEKSDSEMQEWKFKGDVEMRKKGIKPLSWSVQYIQKLDEFIAKNP